MFVIDRDTLLCVRFYISIEIQAMTNTPSCSTSGFPKITVTSVCAATTFPTTFGSGKAFSKQRRGMWCITATLRNTSSGSASGSTSGKLPLTAGERCRWCRTSRAWALPLFPLGRALRPCHTHQRTDEAGLGAENRPRRASRFAVEHGQHIHSHRPCREHQSRQGEIHGED